MSDKFESELNALLNANDDKLKLREENQHKQQDKAAEFLKSFKEVARTTIRPTLEQIKGLLDARGRSSRIEEEDDHAMRDGKRQSASIALYFNATSSGYVSRPREYPHINFSCDKDRQAVDVYTSTIGPNHGGQGGRETALELDKVTPAYIKAIAMKVMREIYSG